MKSPFLKKRLLLLVGLIFLTFEVSTAQSAESSGSEDLFKSIDYPELQVVPRASDRLSMEAERERDAGVLANWPIITSSALTLYAGLTLKGSYRLEPPLSDKDKLAADDAALVGQIVGASGIAIAVGLPLLNSYGNHLARIRAIKGNDRRAQLLRERLAEEVIEKQARLMNIVRWSSVAANFLASSSMSGRAEESKAKYAQISALVAFLPVFFPPKQIDVHRKQEEYKKKIYSPVVSFDFIPQREVGKLLPTFTLSWSL